MISTTLIKKRLEEREYDDRLCKLYATENASKQRARLIQLIHNYEECFGETEVELFSAPGRTELGGNHTDHQHGNVLAASVNLDTVACASPNGTNIINIQSEGYPMEHISLDELMPKLEEVNKTAALIRGIAAAIAKQGCQIGGFNAYVISDVPSGSGLSSSAAFETLIGVIFNRLFCQKKFNAMEIAKIGQYAENVYFGKPCGLMDQMASSIGNVVAIDFENADNPKVEEIAFPFAKCGYSLCIIDSGADHADLTEDYAAVSQEMKAVAKYFGKNVLRDITETQFFAEIPQLRMHCGDRAVLRAAHFFAENQRAKEEADALRNGDFDRFCHLVKQSGQSSFMYLQNVYSNRLPRQQAVAVALMTAERLLNGKGAFRVHGGGFAGTIQAFVPNAMLDEFKAGMELILGKDARHVLTIRPVGGVVLLA